MSEIADHKARPGTVHPLEISIAQIQNAMASSEQGVARLSDNFVEVATLLDKLLAQVSGCKSDDEEADLAATAERIKAVMNDSLRSFQFYDRLTQRMNHVIIVLEQLMACMTMNQSVTESEIYNRILSNFTLEDEKDLLRSLLSDQDWSETALINSDDNNNNTVELF